MIHRAFKKVAFTCFALYLADFSSNRDFLINPEDFKSLPSVCLRSPKDFFGELRHNPSSSGTLFFCLFGNRILCIWRKNYYKLMPRLYFWKNTVVEVRIVSSFCLFVCLFILISSTPKLSMVTSVTDQLMLSINQESTYFQTIFREMKRTC